MSHYDDRSKQQLEHQVRLVESLGVFALKTLLTLNSGATIILLTVLAGWQKGGGIMIVDVAQIQTAMLWFLGGIAGVMLAITVTYVVAQVAVANWPDGGVGFGLHVALMLTPAASSFVAFVMGFLHATAAFQPQII